MLWPVSNKPIRPAPIDSGIDSDTTTVLRQSPRKSRIISETRMDEITASRITLVTAARTKID